MGEKINSSGANSEPAYRSGNVSFTNLFSSVTHPSVRTRNKDELMKRIRDGNDVLSHLPTRLDPNIEFSDDEDEEDESQDRENKISEALKTPVLNSIKEDCAEKITGFKDRSYGTSSTAEFQNLLSARRPQNNSYQKFMSAQKPSHSRKSESFNYLSMSENRVKKPSMLSNDTFKSKVNLIPKQEFKIPESYGPSQRKISSVENILPAKATPSTKITYVNRKPYTIFEEVGAGGSCKVYSAIDDENHRLVALKHVQMKKADPVMREGYKKEIEYLKLLQSSNRVIKMYDYEYIDEQLIIVLERGEVDFAKFISNEAKLKRLTSLMIKFYWAQMLEAVADIHKLGIVHSDLKPANFLLVSGNLKLIDFGIATSVPDDKTSTFRETQVGTLNYMSPEAITQFSVSGSDQVRFKLGVKSDVWSLGCILYNLVYGYTPFNNIKNYVQKIHAITNPNYQIEFKPLADRALLNVLKICLKRNPKERASVDDLLKHPYVTENNNENSAKSDKSSELESVMKQMQILTPRRMSYLSKVVKELSEK